MGQELLVEESLLGSEATKHEDTEIVEEEIKEEPKKEKPESVEDSVRKAIADIKAKANSGDSNSEEGDTTPSANEKPQIKATSDVESPKRGRPKKEVIPDLGDAYLDPPERLPKEKKELFKKLPNDMKREVVNLFRDQEAHFSKTQGELSKAEREARHIVEAVRPFYMSVPQFAAKGITESQLVTTLIGNHRELLDPKTSKAKYLEIGRSLGHNVRFVDENGADESGANGYGDIESHPQFKALQERLNQVTSHLSRQVEDQTAVSEIQKIEEAQKETDSMGNLAWPEFHSRDFVESKRSSVAALRRNDPNLSFAEALKIEALKHRLKNGYPTQAAPTKPPQNNNQRTVVAATTVRGGKTPSTIGSGFSERAKPGETYEESVRAAIAKMKRGAIS